MWRRFCRASPHHNRHHLQYSLQVDALMRRASPFAGWSERANWMIDVADWLRRGPKSSLLDEEAWRRIRQQRTAFLLDWLDNHRAVRRVVQATLQKTLREAVGPELFCATGLPREPAFFSELAQRLIKAVLPKPPSQQDLSTLLTSMFPARADADWLLGLDDATLSRIWKLCADDGIEHGYRQQIDEALIYLVTMIVAVGISQDVRGRLEPKLGIQATPFMALRRELEKYLAAGAHDEAALRSVRMLIAVCQAQTDRIYAHLDEYGVSVGLVYRIERMRAQLRRMGRLIDLRSAPREDGGAHTGQAQTLLVDLINAHRLRSSVSGLVRRSFSLLARKMVERNASHGEQYIARDRTEYSALLKAACVGGVLTALAVMGKFALAGAGLAHFFNGAAASLTYVLVFLAISALGGVLATKQPAVTAPALAAKMGALDTVDGLRSLLTEIICLLRSQAAAVIGNLVAVIPTMLAVSFAVLSLSGGSILTPEKAHATIGGLSLLGPTPLFAAFTGVLLWLASLAAGFADNWFALHRLRDALAHQRRLVHALGASRAERWACWLESHLAGIVSNVTLGILLGMAPVVAQFFGLPVDVRHVTLSTGALTAAAVSLGWDVFATAPFWQAAGGVLLIGLLNVGVAFSCAFMLALRARDVPRRVRRRVLKALVLRLAAAPRSFLWPEKPGPVVGTVRSRPEETPEQRKRRRTGS